METFCEGMYHGKHALEGGKIFSGQKARFGSLSQNVRVLGARSGLAVQVGEDALSLIR